MKNSDNKKLLCSFCGANESDVRFLVEGESAYICEECIDKASQIVNDTKKPSTFKFDFENQKPKDISQKLDSHVIDQVDAKKCVSVAVYNHYKRINCIDINSSDVDKEKSNILLIGST